MEFEKPPLGYKVISEDGRAKIGIETIQDRNNKIPWEESGAKVIGNILIKARCIEIDFDPENNHRWQYGLFYPDNSIKKGPAIYKEKKDAISDGVDLIKKEIQSAEED
ncbi:MAG: hypothetical protein HGA61_04255 [Candidatus Moranbacteria bacterium]|nr:hypothetical protein [Candidatus Moranbacteria bacterium]